MRNLLGSAAISAGLVVGAVILIRCLVAFVFWDINILFLRDSEWGLIPMGLIFWAFVTLALYANNRQ